MSIKVESYHGQELATHIPQLAQLRMAVFYDFPYLYEGSLAYEEKYLQLYLQSDRSHVSLAWDQDQLIGATTSIPFEEEVESIQGPLKRSGLDLSSAMYFGESILLPQYRGQGLGREFFKLRHQHAQNIFANLTLTGFCSVDRRSDHPLRPSGYQPLDPFWRSEGYEPFLVEKARLSWTDRNDQVETSKTLTYWLRHWN